MTTQHDDAQDGSSEQRLMDQIASLMRNDPEVAAVGGQITGPLPTVACSHQALIGILERLNIERLDENGLMVYS